MTSGWIPTMSACVYANTSWLRDRNSVSCCASSFFSPLLIWQHDLVSLGPPGSRLVLPQTSRLIHLLIGGGRCLSPSALNLSFLTQLLGVVLVSGSGLTSLLSRNLVIVCLLPHWRLMSTLLWGSWSSQLLFRVAPLRWQLAWWFLRGSHYP